MFSRKGCIKITYQSLLGVWGEGKEAPFAHFIIDTWFDTCSPASCKAPGCSPFTLRNRDDPFHELIDWEDKLRRDTESGSKYNQEHI